MALPGSRLAIMAVCKDSPGVCLVEPCAAEWDILEVFLVLICKVMMGREREQADEQPVTRPLRGPRLDCCRSALGGRNTREEAVKEDLNKR